MDLVGASDLLGQQSGVASRPQLVALGATDADLRRWVRRRELARVHTGIYVNHTGPLTWENRAWAAVLFHWPAALTHESAVNRAGEVLHVAVDATRTTTRLPAVRVHRLVGLEARVQWHVGPPRVRLEDALLSMCSEAANRIEAMALVSDACRRRVTTPARLTLELRSRTRVTHRAWLLAVLQDAADGIQSPLESAYRRRVERRHGLPVGRRQWQERTEDGIVYRDVRYDAFGVVVELDGRIGHLLSRDRWNDQDRDLLAATDDVVTLRLGWRHVESTPCRTADRVGRVLALRGWRGIARCRSACGT